MQPWELTAVEGLKRIAAGTLTAEAWIAGCLERVAEREPVVHAFTHRAAKPEAGAPGGPLHGMPLGVKDVFDTADMPSEYGSPIWSGYRPRADAACVAWARAAGAAVMGKTVTTEFATRQPGSTTNPHHPGHTPGGSSSGSAAGVAAGFFPVALATQTAGSIIRPAAFCGIVGYKPSFNTVARAGMKMMSETLDTIGAVARSVEDCALFVGALAGLDLRDGVGAAAPRIGVCGGPTWERAAPETVVLMERAASRLGAVRDVTLPEPFGQLEQAHLVVMNHESARSLGWEMARHRDQLSGALRERMLQGLAASDAERTTAYGIFAAARAAFAQEMDGLDVLVTPSAPGEAPRGIAWTGDPCFNFVWTSLGVPCVTVPTGTGPNGLPLGLTVVGRMGDDRAVLAWAEWVRRRLA